MEKITKEHLKKGDVFESRRSKLEIVEVKSSSVAMRDITPNQNPSGKTVEYSRELLRWKLHWINLDVVKKPRRFVGDVVNGGAEERKGKFRKQREEFLKKVEAQRQGFYKANL